MAGAGFPRNPTLTVLDKFVSQIIDPMSANLYDETTTNTKTLEDPGQFLGTDPTVTRIISTTDTQVTTNQQLVGLPNSVVMVVQNQQGQQILDVGTNSLGVASLYNVATNPSQKYGASAEISYNIGAKLGSYLSQCDRVNIVYNLPDDQFTYDVSPINDIKLDGVFSQIWARCFCPGILATTSTPSPKNMPIHKIGGPSTIPQ